VAPNETIQLIRGFGPNTIDLNAIADWLTEHKIKTVATHAPTEIDNRDHYQQYSNETKP
jgi:hypothetical protein